MGVLGGSNPCEGTLCMLIGDEGACVVAGVAVVGGVVVVGGVAVVGVVGYTIGLTPGGDRGAP